MINLIPNEEKKRAVSDFYVRLIVTCFVVLGVTVLVASAGLLPAYFLSSVKKNLVHTKLDLQEKEPVPAFDQKNLSVVSDLNNKLTLVDKARSSKYIVSQKIINEIIKDKMSDIKITEILYQSDPKSKSVSIKGTASSRDRLLLFKKTLEEDVLFKKVDLPISSFVKGSDIQFNITIIPA